MNSRLKQIIDWLEDWLCTGLGLFCSGMLLGILFGALLF